MTTRLFAHGIYDQPRSMAVLKRIILPLLIVHVVLALWSGYRAIVQVYSLDLAVPETTVRPGSVVRYDVVGSGRVYVTTRLVLIQGTTAETLSTTRVDSHTNPSYDPRPIRGGASVALTSELLAKFAEGPALLRAVAVGRPQWLRTPPPTVRDLPVTIAR